MILITGANGYIGSRVLKVLSEKKLSIRCLVRKPTIQKLNTIGIAKEDNKNISYVEGNALDYNSLLIATKGVDVIYYFIHHMDNNDSKKEDRFDNLDRIAIENTVKACCENKVKRIIYLGGMYNPKENLSLHLKSRKEVEDVIIASGLKYTIFRAAVIIGRGAAAFEIIDSVVKKIPIIPIIDGGETKIQPIFYKDAIKYLVDCLEKKETINRSFDIGGKDILSYEDIIKQYAQELKIKRYFIRVTGMRRRLLSKILSIISPVNANVAYWLTESLSNRMVASTDDSKDLKRIFNFEPLGFKESIKRTISTQSF